LICESGALFRVLKDDAGLAEVLVSLGRIVQAQGDIAAAAAWADGQAWPLEQILSAIPGMRR
jgi:hypothetical protein